MKRSRTGIALLFIGFLVVGFLALLITVAHFTESDEDTTSVAEILGAEKIGIVPIEGTISSADDILKQLRKFRKRSSIKAILLRINSPGGAVAPAQEIYREIERTKAKKPVVASMETVGASAAYYVASNADRVVCSAGTITGSIGVIMFMAEIHKAINKIGVDVNVIKAGKYKDIGSGVRPMSEEERKLLETFAKQIHEQFIKDVAQARKGKIDEDKLRSVCDGSFFTGEKAKELGLVDSLGNFYDAVEVAAKLAGIKGDPKLVYPEKKWGGLVDLLSGSLARLAQGLSDKVRVAPPSLWIY
ncbi:MAG: signal peptide peptidase SppA [Deltaproteobacteria bacterium]|nr:signal peptide peptidase SppA [Deltaproteobacteria bacterium]